MNDPKKPRPKRPQRPARQRPAPKKPEEKPEAKADHKPEPDNRVENLEARMKELNDRVLRAMAEMENTRRRAEKEVQDARAYAVTGFAREMLSVQDNLGRALKHLPADMKENDGHRAFVEGVEVTERELLNIFERHGIKKINPKGEAFDHNLHQAMFEVETTEHAPGTVMEVVQEGYVIRDRLLRPAMVGVARAPKEDKS